MYLEMLQMLLHRFKLVAISQYQQAIFEVFIAPIDTTTSMIELRHVKPYTCMHFVVIPQVPENTLPGKGR
jgi:hypothetical protein